jgi:hypothetical protein
MSQENTRKLVLKRFASFIFVAAIIISSSVLINVYQPAYKKYTNDDWNDINYVPQYNPEDGNILFDSHSHTIYSDGSLTPEQNILWHIAMGYNATVITDHLSSTNTRPWLGAEKAREIAREKYNDKIKVLIGIEYTTYDFHMNIILPPDATGYKEAIKYYGKKPTHTQIQEVIKAAHELGGVTTLNHLPWSLPRMPDHPSLEQFLAWGIDYVEIINGDEIDYDSIPFCQANGIGLIAGTDMHTPEWKKGYDWNPVGGWTLLKVSEFSEQAIFDELKARRTQIINVSIDDMPEYNVVHKVNPAYTALRPFIQVGEIFKSYWLPTSELDGSGVSIWVSYLVGIFIISEIIRSVSKRIRK